MEAVLNSPVGFGETQPRIEGQVIRHFLVGVEINGSRTGETRTAFDIGDQHTPDAAALNVRGDGNVLQMPDRTRCIGHDITNHLPGRGDPDLISGNQSRKICAHGRRLATYGCDIGLIGEACDLRDPRDIGHIGIANDGLHPVTTYNAVPVFQLRIPDQRSKPIRGFADVFAPGMSALGVPSGHLKPEIKL